MEFITIVEPPGGRMIVSGGNNGRRRIPMLQMIVICPTFGIGFYMFCSVAARGLRTLRTRPRPDATASAGFIVTAE